MIKKKYPNTKTELTQEQFDAVVDCLGPEWQSHMECVGNIKGFDSLILAAMGVADRGDGCSQMLREEREENARLRNALEHVVTALSEICNYS